MATVAQLNECQKKYAETRQQAIFITNRIQRVLLERPAAANGDWSMVGSMQHYKAELQAICDELTGEGEYATPSK